MAKGKANRRRSKSNAAYDYCDEELAALQEIMASAVECGSHVLPTDD